MAKATSPHPNSGPAIVADLLKSGSPDPQAIALLPQPWRDIAKAMAEVDGIERLRTLAQQLDSRDDSVDLVEQIFNADLGETQGSRLVRAVERDGAELFRTPAGGAHITVPVDGYRQTLRLRSQAARDCLAYRHYRMTQRAPHRTVLDTALGALQAQALYEGEEHEVCVRIGQHNGHLYLDLGDPQWRAIEISAAGWRVVPNPPVRFRRPSGMLALPEPVRGGSVEDLRPFINVASDDEFRLLVTVICAMLNPSGPYVVLLLGGEQDSAKSTVARVIRRLVDPNQAPLRTVPHSEHDLFISANNSWLTVFDTLSGVPQWLSDALCRLATGGGHATRTLYTDDDETLFDLQRPVILNGIGELAGRPDLIDRAVSLLLPSIADDQRRTEKAFWAEFDAASPRILGALLDIAACALARLDCVTLDRLPRMADFARWGAAAAPAIGWTPEAFLAAYEANRAEGSATALDDSLVGQAVVEYMEKTAEFTGSATEVLQALQIRDVNVRARESWPRSAQALASELRRIAPSLKAAGIDVVFGKRETSRKRTRLITIRRVA